MQITTNISNKKKISCRQMILLAIPKKMLLANIDTDVILLWFCRTLWCHSEVQNSKTQTIVIYRNHKEIDLYQYFMNEEL